MTTTGLTRNDIHQKMSSLMLTKGINMSDEDSFERFCEVDADSRSLPNSESQLLYIFSLFAKHGKHREMTYDIVDYLSQDDPQFKLELLGQMFEIFMCDYF